MNNTSFTRMCAHLALKHLPDEPVWYHAIAVRWSQGRPCSLP